VAGASPQYAVQRLSFPEPQATGSPKANLSALFFVAAKACIDDLQLL